MATKHPSFEFSQRLDWRFAPNRISATAQERLAAGAKLLDMTVSNPTTVGLPETDFAGWEHLSGTEGAHYRPEPTGALAVREAIAAYYHDHDREIDPEQIVVTASTSEAYAHLFRLLSDPGDNVLIPRPGYPLFAYLAGLEGLACHPFRLLPEDRWRLDLASLTEALDPRSRALLLIHPNNPTGSFITDNERARIVEICEDRKLPLVVDEVFLDYLWAGSAASFSGESRTLTFTLSGLSKVCALPQMKLSWIVVSGPADVRDAAIERLRFIGDLFLSVATPIQLATPAFLAERKVAQDRIRNRVMTNIASLVTTFANSPITFHPPDGGWSAIVRLPAVLSDEEWAIHMLEQHDALFHPGYLFDFTQEACLVCSLLGKPEDVAEAARRLLAAVLTRCE